MSREGMGLCVGGASRCGLRCVVCRLYAFEAAASCDFATIGTVTLRRFYLLLCIDIATRSVYFAGITDHPGGVWASQAARNLLLQYGH